MRRISGWASARPRSFLSRGSVNGSPWDMSRTPFEVTTSVASIAPTETSSSELTTEGWRGLVPDRALPRGALPADDVAIRRGQTPASQQMIVPEGVVIEGTLTSASETQIAGRVDGDVTVEARLSLEPASVVTGKVRAATCSLRGKLDGNLECTNELVIGESGRLNADAISGKDMTIAGKVKGNVQCGGMLRLMNTAQLDGNIRARSIVINEGAVFNGTCSMGKPKQSSSQSTKKSQ